MADAAESLDTQVIAFPDAQTMESFLMSHNLVAGVEFGDSLSVKYSHYCIWIPSNNLGPLSERNQPSGKAQLRHTLPR